jgi:hypothetical protein
MAAEHDPLDPISTHCSGNPEPNNKCFSAPNEFPPCLPHSAPRAQRHSSDPTRYSDFVRATRNTLSGRIVAETFELTTVSIRHCARHQGAGAPHPIRRQARHRRRI